MKKEKYWFIILTLLVFGFLFLVMWVGSKGGFILGEEETEQTEKTAEPLNITIPTPTTGGTLTVYDENGGSLFSVFR